MLHVIVTIGIDACLSGCLVYYGCGRINQFNMLQCKIFVTRFDVNLWVCLFVAQLLFCLLVWPVVAAMPLDILEAVVAVPTEFTKVC